MRAVPLLVYLVILGALAAAGWVAVLAVANAISVTEKVVYVPVMG